MKLITGKLDYGFQALSSLPPKDVVLFTGNATIKTDGGLVMGRGAAKVVRDTYPGIDVLLGREIMKIEQNPHWLYPYRTYGLAWLMAGWIRRAQKMLTITETMNPADTTAAEITQLPRPIGVFQVKYNFRDQADLDLIAYSTGMLESVARGSPERTFHINFPGIGWGGLTRERVAPILSSLPDNVSVYEER